ncbi:MAG: hypothetical protein ACTH0Y_01860 [Luteimonas sp.]
MNTSAMSMLRDSICSAGQLRSANSTAMVWMRLASRPPIAASTRDQRHFEQSVVHVDRSA